MRNRILLFVLGIVLGVAIGVVFDVGIKTIINQVKQIHLSLNKINTNQDKLSQRLDSLQGKLKDDKKNPTQLAKSDYKAPVVAQAAMPKHDSSAIKQVNNNDAQEVDSNVATQNQDSNIVVMTNQLVSVKTLPLKNIDSLMVDKNTARSDSMIAAMSQVDEDKEPEYYRIEFWQSPLNFKGYKMSRGKIVLYGINSTTQLRLVKWDDSYYLLSNTSVYKVSYTDDYKPFEKVNDKTVLKKFTL